MPGGTVTLTPSTGDPVTAILDGSPDRSGGVGGWVTSERSQRRPGKWFRATTDDTYSLDLIFDVDVAEPTLPDPKARSMSFSGYAALRPKTVKSVERRVRALREMGKAPELGGEPPHIVITGDIWDHDKALKWVLEGMTLGDRLWNENGSLRRQHVQVTLSRYAPISEIGSLRVVATRKGRKPGRRVVIAKQGDTLRTIALRELGSGTRWKELRDWNKKKLRKVNPDARLRPGTRLTVRPGVDADPKKKDGADD